MQPDEAPDIETASESYASRFVGATGHYFLTRQAAIIEDFLSLANKKPLRILELGGGHAQLTPRLLELGHQVWVQGSSESCAARLQQARLVQSDRLQFFVSPLSAVPFPNAFFDVVIAIRLIAHLNSWPGFLEEACRLSSSLLIIDYASLLSFNILTPLLFKLKKHYETNTRPYLCHRNGELSQVLERLSFRTIALRKEFFLPMVVHRALKHAAFSTALERAFELSGLTACLGSPALLCALRIRS